MNQATVKEDVKSEEKDGEYSDNFEDEKSAEDEADTEDPPPRPLAPEPPEVAKPSLLSKVSLMESLDSTLETKRPAAAASLLSPQKQVVQAANTEEVKSDEHLIPESRPDKAVPSLIKTGPDDEFSGSTREIRELQAALRAAQMTTTGTGSRYSDFDLPLASRLKQGTEQSSERQIVIEKSHHGETRARGFHLQPVVVTDDFIPAGNASNSLASLSDERSFGLKPVKAGAKGFPGSDLDASYDLVSSVEHGHLGLASGTSTPVVSRRSGGRGFELEPAANVPGFSLQPVTEATALGVRLDSVSGSVVEGRGFDLQPAQAGGGFSLQPVANLMQSGGEEGKTQGHGQEEDDEEDTPPQESLQSIKSIARARKGAGKDSAKKTF